MQNEFEKQVQQKMDELKLQPTAPVWNHVYDEIRKRRDRRRLFWIPFIIMLFSGVTYFLLQQPGDNSTVTGDAIIKEGKKIKIEKNPEPGKNGNENQTVLPTTIPHEPNTKIETVSKQGKQENKMQARKEFVSQRRQQYSHNAASFANTTLVNEKQAVIKQPGNFFPEKEQNVISKISGDTNVIFKVDTASVVINAKEQVIIKDENNIPPVDTTSSEKPQLLYKQKWQKILYAGIGSSGLGTGLPSMLKSMDATFPDPQNSSGSPQSPARPVIERKGISFSAGLTFRKSLSSKINFETGLGYNYFSTRTNVGQFVRQDTVLVTNFSNVRVSSYYLNTPAQTNYHTNQFHFITIPVALQMQLLNKVPLHLQVGISLHQLIYSKALLYQGNRQIFYYDKDAFNKTQLFSQFGLSYTFNFSSGRQWTFGPHMQYGISRLLKQNSDKHLYSLGIKSTFSLK